MEADLERAAVEPLPGTVKFYERHLFVCTGQTGWPARIEEGGGFVQALATALAPHLPRMSHRLKLTACDEPSAGPGHDLLIFPDMVRYRGVREGDLPALIEEHFVGNRISGRVPHEPLPGQHVFVCVHGERDERCGVCGPPLAERFAAELAARGLAKAVAVRRSSHIGGHRYAGNVLIYPGGDWYGYVTPADVPRLIEEHLLHRQLVADLWRGRMGLSPEEQLQLLRSNDGR